MSKTPRPTFLTVPEAARYLGISAQTVRAQIRNGKIAAERRGDYLIEMAEVARYQREHAGRPGLRQGAKIHRPSKEVTA